MMYFRLGSFGMLGNGNFGASARLLIPAPIGAHYKQASAGVSHTLGLKKTAAFILGGKTIMGN